jgi:hypothetical protein
MDNSCLRRRSCPNEWHESFVGACAWCGLPYCAESSVTAMGRNFSPEQILTLKSVVRRGWVPLRLYSWYDLFHLDCVDLLCDYWGWNWRLGVRIARNFSRAWRTRGRSAEVHGEPLFRLTVGIDFPTGWWGV